MGTRGHVHWREPIIGAVDETFLEHMMLVFMDLPSGYLLVEDSMIKFFVLDGLSS